MKENKEEDENMEEEEEEGEEEVFKLPHTSLAPSCTAALRTALNTSPP